MKIKWYCGRCKDWQHRQFNLKQIQEGFVISEIQVECNYAHSKKVKLDT